jgi:hypothetical protein
MSDLRCAECDCLDGNCKWIMSADERIARRKADAYRAGLEAAAIRADREADAAQVALEMAKPDEHAAKTACASLVKRFRAHAAAIRAMMGDTP